MHFSQLGAVTALVAVSQAILLPPTITAADSEIVNTLPFEVAADVEGKDVNVPCMGCPVMVTDLLGQSKYASAPNLESMFRFIFRLDHGPSSDHLVVNGRQIYPVDSLLQTMDQPLTAEQLVRSPEGIWNIAAEPEMSFKITAGTLLSSSDQEEMELVTVHLDILEIAGRPINQFPSMEIKLLQTPSGKLMIGDIQLDDNISALKNLQAPPGMEDCTNIICEWRAIIADKIAKMKGCGGKRPAEPHGSMMAPPRPFIKPGHGAHSSKPYHGHGGPRPHGHHHRHRHNRFARVVRSIVFHVFVPIMIGVVVGITASLVGMIVGHILIFVWRVLFRRGERAQGCRFQEEAAEKSNDDESKGFLEEENAPPVYEDAPAYEEAVVEKV